jgi:uncharacterized membrane protein YqjE
MSPPTEGFRAAAARLAESVVALLSTRLQLASVEFAEERERTATRLMLLGGGLALLALAAIFASAFVVVLFWDTHRLLAIAAVTIVCAVGGIVLLARARAIGREAPTPFSATLAELDKDREWFARGVRREP